MEVWLNPGSWSQQQWLAFAILAFIILAIIVLLFRLYQVLKMTTRKRERPNLRVARRVRSERNSE